MIRLSDEQGQFLVGFLVGDMGEPFRSLRDHLQQQLDAPDHQEDLIETIASIVNSSTAKVAMPNVFVDALRRAILSPRELSRLKALKDTHQKCGSCERELQSGEMVSLHNQLPLCIACRTPTSYACPKCHGKIGMPTGIMRIIKKSIVECVTCALPQDERAEITEDPPGQADRVGQGGMDDGARRARDSGPTAGFEWRTMPTAVFTDDIPGPPDPRAIRTNWFPIAPPVLFTAPATLPPEADWPTDDIPEADWPTGDAAGRIIRGRDDR